MVRQARLALLHPAAQAERLVQELAARQVPPVRADRAVVTITVAGPAAEVRAVADPWVQPVRPDPAEEAVRTARRVTMATALIAVDSRSSTRACA